jgi:hypothetical protein
MRQFKWIEWNLEKIDAHALSAQEVEAAFDRSKDVETAPTRCSRRYRQAVGSGLSGGTIEGTTRARMCSGIWANFRSLSSLRTERKPFMTTPRTDERSPERRARDEQIAAEPKMPPLELPLDAPVKSVETHLDPQRCHPVAVMGVVENGLVRPLDPAVRLPEHARVIIVASEET